MLNLTIPFTDIFFIFHCCVNYTTPGRRESTAEVSKHTFDWTVLYARCLQHFAIKLEKRSQELQMKSLSRFWSRKTAE